MEKANKNRQQQLEDKIAQLHQRISELQAAEERCKILEKKLRESEQEYRQLIERSPDGIFVCDLQGNLLTVNKATSVILGYTREELLSMNVWDVVPPRYKEQFRERVALIKKGKTLEEPMEYQVIGKDGKKHIIEVRSTPVKEDGKIVGFQGIARDITARKQAEMALAESEEKYRSLVENLNVGVYRNTPGPKGEFIEANPAIISMFSYQNKKEFHNVKVADLYQNPEDRIKFNEKISRDGYVRNEELKLRKKDGTPFWGSVTAIAVTDEKGRVKYYDGIIEDITPRKQAEAERGEALERMKQALDREMVFKLKTAHHFFNPLCIAKGYLSLFLEKENGEGHTEEIRKAIEAIDRIQNVVANIVRRGEIRE